MIRNGAEKESVARHQIECPAETPTHRGGARILAEGGEENVAEGVTNIFMTAALLRQTSRQKTINSKPGVCFLNGTKVYVGNDKFKTIENIIVGDSVWSYDEKDAKFEIQPVIDTFRRFYKGKIVRIVTSTFDTLSSTLEHLYYINNTWKEAQELKEGDALYSYNDNISSKVEKILLIDTFVWVYNFSVEKNRNYFISASKILVHNDCKQKAPVSLNKPSIFTKELNKIKNGEGTPRRNADGSTKRIENRNNTKWEKEWVDAEEFEVYIPGTPNVNRIIRKQTGVDQTGNPTYKYGATDNHFGEVKNGKPAVLEIK